MFALTTEFVKRPCAFVIKIEIPLQTLQRIMQFLLERKIMVENMQMHTLGGGDALLTVHGQIEKDKVRHAQQMLEKIEGVLAVEILECKMTNLMRLKTGS